MRAHESYVILYVETLKHYSNKSQLGFLPWWGNLGQLRRPDTRSTQSWNGHLLSQPSLDTLPDETPESPPVDSMIGRLQKTYAEKLEAKVVADGACPDLAYYSVRPPGRLHEFIYRHGDLDGPGLGFECLKWTRIVSQFYDANFASMDPDIGPLAEHLHSVCVQMTAAENSMEVANQDFITRQQVVSVIAGKKKLKVREEVEAVRVQRSLDEVATTTLLQSRLSQVDLWHAAKLEEFETRRQSIKKKVDDLVERFVRAVADMLDRAKALHLESSESVRC